MAPAPFLDKSGMAYLKRELRVQTDDSLTVEDGVLSVNVTDEITAGDSRPITSNGVHSLAGEVRSLVETGTWTATINAGNITTQQCTYQKVVDMCTISFFIQGTGIAASTNGNYLYIGGAPYTPRAGANWYGGGGHMQGLRIDSGHYPTGPIIQPNGLIYYRTAQSASTAAAGGYAHIANGSTTFFITGTITYPIAE